MAVLGNEEHKQRLNLSSLAHSVVEMDRSVFDEKGTLSGFLNRVITAFREQADASIDVAVEDRRDLLEEKGYDDAMVERLSEEYRLQLQQKKEAYPQGDSVTFRLNNQNFDLLYEQRAEERNYASPGKYLKALVEEYARLSPSEREGIFFARQIEALQTAIDADYCLQVALSGNLFTLRPYKVMADPFNSHLYLVGLSRKQDSDREVIASLRITRLEQVKVRRQKGRLTADERRQIEEKLRRTGVQYLVGDIQPITLRLTAQGRRDFLQRSYMRPLPDKIEQDIYHFSCTPLQIRNYFLPFGKEVEILSPDHLRQEFIDTYQQALSLYK